MKIVTDHTYPPIPVREHDWHAWLDGHEEDGMYGHGCTKSEAVTDLLESWGDSYCNDCAKQHHAEDCSREEQPHGEILLCCPYCGSDNIEKLEEA